MVKTLIWLICGYKQNRAIFGRNATPVATLNDNGLTESPYLIVLIGAGTTNRTRDLLITNQLLHLYMMRSSGPSSQ